MQLSRYSADWAKRLAARGVIEHRNESDYGENIFCSWSSSPAHTVAGDEPVHHWYNEIKDHKFGKEPTSLKTGHFTQVSERQVAIGASVRLSLTPIP